MRDTTTSVNAGPVTLDAPTAHFDLLAIGAGPAGQKAAIQASKLGKRAAIVEGEQLGGCSVFSGTIPSKTLREAVLYLTGFSQRAIYGQSYRVKDDVTMDDLRARAAGVSQRETDVIRDQLARNRVTLFDGMASFVDDDTVVITAADGRRQVVDADRDRHRHREPPRAGPRRSSSTRSRSSTPTASSSSAASRSRSSSSERA